MASPYHAVGNFAPISRPKEVHFDPVRGLIVGHEFHGIGPDSLLGLANLYVQNRIAYKLTRGPISTIAPTISGGQDGMADAAQSNWQLLCNEIQKSIFESPYAKLGQSLFPDLAVDVQEAWKSHEEGDAEGVQAIFDFIATNSPGEMEYADYLYTKLEHNQTHFATGQYVLKRTISISNFYQGDIPGEDAVEHLLSTQTLLQESDMPQVMAQKVSGIPAPSVPTAAALREAWGWRQLPSQMVTGAHNRVEVSTEWWYDLWDTILYGNPL